MSDITYGPGKVATAHFSRGTPLVLIDCLDCDCPEHEYERENPKPAGTYIEVRLDNEDAAVGVGRVVVLTESEYDERRADARAALEAVADELRAEGAARALRDYADQLDQEAAEYAARLRVTHVLCRHCHLRYGERDQYPCVIAGAAHHYDEDELAEAAQVHVETTHDGDYARAHAIQIEARDE